jgi:iron-sulfur cluster insertion protein
MSYDPLLTTIVITDSAAQKVFELMAEEGNLGLKLRVSISGGGCSGYQYAFGFEEQKQEDDFVISKSVVNFIIDPISRQYLEGRDGEKGAEIDYVADLEGERFVIRNNPNAKTTCGCGSSFMTE